MPRKQRPDNVHTFKMLSNACGTFPKTLTIGNGYNFYAFFFSCKESELDLCALPEIVSNCYVLNILIYLDH